MNKVLADDHSYHLSLKKMAVAAKKDAVIFKHLAEPLANGIISIPNSWLDTNAFLIFGTMAATVLAWIICILLILKIRKLTIALGVLQNVVNVKSQPVFIYDTPTTTSEPPTSLENLILSEITWVHGVFIVCMSIIVILCICICVLWYKRPAKGTVLKLELTSGCQCVLIDLLSLPLCPSYYKFSSSTIKDISVTQFPNSQIIADWLPFSVIDKQSGKSINIPTVFSIGYLTNRKVTKILKQPFCAYLYINHQGIATLLKQGSLLEDLLEES